MPIQSPAGPSAGPISLTPITTHAIPNHPVEAGRRQSGQGPCAARISALRAAYACFDGVTLLRAADPARAASCKSRPGGGVDGPLRLEFHQPARCQGPRLDPRQLPRDPGPGRLRGALCPSVRSICRRSMPGGHALRATIDDILSRFSPFSDEWELLSTALNGASEVLKVDPEGRIMLGEALEGACGHRRCRDLRRARPQIPALGSPALRGASGDGPDAAARCEAHAGRAAARRERRDHEEARAGRADEPQENDARHVPGAAGRSAGGAGAAGRAGAISTAPSGPAAMPAPSSTPRRTARLLALDRDPTAIAGGADLVAAMAGRLTLAQARFGELAEEARALPDGAARRRGARYRRLLDADRRGRARLLLPLRRAARHAHGPRRARAPPISSTRPMRACSPTSSIIMARSAARAPSPAPSSRRGARAAIETTKQLADLVAEHRLGRARRRASGDAGVPGAAHRRQ